jgi:hypothetical protein
LVTQPGLKLNSVLPLRCAFATALIKRLRFVTRAPKSKVKKRSPGRSPWLGWPEITLRIPSLTSWEVLPAPVPQMFASVANCATCCMSGVMSSVTPKPVWTSVLYAEGSPRGAAPAVPRFPMISIISKMLLMG